MKTNLSKVDKKMLLKLDLEVMQGVRNHLQSIISEVKYFNKRIDLINRGKFS
jgi:hypothetical protein